MTTILTINTVPGAEYAMRVFRERHATYERTMAAAEEQGHGRYIDEDRVLMQLHPTGALVSSPYRPDRVENWSTEVMEHMLKCDAAPIADSNADFISAGLMCPTAPRKKKRTKKIPHIA